ncbi:MAG: RcnB family protein [Sphingobium sp.]
MKKFILAAVAASLIASPALAAPGRQDNDRGHQMQSRHQDRGHQVKVVKKTTYKPAPVQYRTDWKRGERFDGRKARNYRQIDYRQHRNLKAPPRGYHYVQSGNDAVLVAITSGVISAIFTNALR